MLPASQESDGAHARVRAYDLALRSNRQRLTFGMPPRRLLLAHDRLDWEIDGEADAALLTSIVEVNLLTGGAWTSPVAQCRIRFKDGFILTVSDAATSGYPDEAKRSLYPEFVRDLHHRVARLAGARIRFVSGYTRIQFHLLALCALLMAGMFVLGPIVVFFVVPNTQAVLLLVTGAGLVWPLLRMMHDNSPGTYDPQKLPPELVP